MKAMQARGFDVHEQLNRYEAQTKIMFMNVQIQSHQSSLVNTFHSGLILAVCVRKQNQL